MHRHEFRLRFGNWVMSEVRVLANHCFVDGYVT